MTDLKPGTRVLVNGGLLATLQSYDEAGGSAVYVVDLPGGGTDTHTARIANTIIEPLPILPVEIDKGEAKK